MTIVHTCRRFFMCTLLAAGLSAGISGCVIQEDPVKIAPRYPTLPPKVVAPFLKGSVLELVELVDVDAMRVSNFAVVSGLNNTGDATAPTTVREYIGNELKRHRLPPALIDDKHMAIVRAEVMLPPGARKDQWVDVNVYAMEMGNTVSLSRGKLLRVDLKANGDNPQVPGGTSPQVWAEAEGSIVINPGYAIDSANNTVAARMARRVGVVPGGARVKEDRPIVIRLRQPQRSVATAIADRINHYFQNKPVATREDEGKINLYVPESYNGNYERFCGVIRHLYMNTSSEFAPIKAQQLCEEVVKPGLTDDQLIEISYCWEGLGSGALPFILPLTQSEQAGARVNFAAARAAAFLGDLSAYQVLAHMALTDNHPFQLQAVRTLGMLNDSPSVNVQLRRLLEASSGPVRIEAYRVLARRNDPSILTSVVREQFAMDIVPSKSAPVIYATRQGLPRLALIGSQLEIERPSIYSAIENRLSISAPSSDSPLKIFYNGPELETAAQAQCPADLEKLVACLGGDGPGEAKKMKLSYGEIIAILQQMCNKKLILGAGPDGKQTPVAFVMQEPAANTDEIDSAPTIDGSRPQQKADAGEKH